MKTDKLNTITVAELIRALSEQDPKALVVFSYDYGDYIHTQAVEGIQTVEPRALTETAYSSSGFALADEEDLDGEEADGTVVVLSACIR